MTDERLRTHYNEKHADDLAIASLKVLSPELRWPVDRSEAAVKSLASRVPAGAAVLEVGAGDGQVAESLRLGGVETSRYTILELSDVRLNGLRDRLDDKRYRFECGDIETFSAMTSDRFDVVIMVAVIEHLVDPLRTMAQICGLINPGGFAYIDTPNIAKWTRRVRLLAGRFPSTAAMNEGLTTFEGAPADMYDEGHLHYFSFRSLELMLTERCGFERVERHGYFDGPVRIPARIGSPLAQRWPSMFGEIAVTAYV